MSGLSISGLAIFALALAVAAFAPGPGIAAIVGRVLGRGREGRSAMSSGCRWRSSASPSSPRPSMRSSRS